jgi:hypothetical protein
MKSRTSCNIHKAILNHFAPPRWQVLFPAKATSGPGLGIEPDAWQVPPLLHTARAGNRRFCLLSALRAHAEAPYKPDLLWEMLRALNRPGRARTGPD